MTTHPVTRGDSCLIINDCCGVDIPNALITAIAQHCLINNEHGAEDNYAIYHDHLQAAARGELTLANVRILGDMFILTDNPHDTRGQSYLEVYSEEGYLRNDTP